MIPKWLNRDEYPFVSKYFEVNGHKLHYIDEGRGNVVLFVHGTPSWSFDFRNVIKWLMPHYRCIAFDHIGFGLSDKPADYNYSTDRHSDTLSKFVHHLKLTDINLVVHDFGGPIGLKFAIENPQLVKRLVVLNSWLWSSEGDPEFQRIRRVLTSPLLPFLYKYLNFSPRFILPASFGDKKPAPDIVSHYTKPFRTPGERHGAVAFAHSLARDQKWFESLWQRKGAIDQKPTLFIWGMKDKFVAEKHLEKFLAGFPHSDVVKLEGCGHFPQEEEADQTARHILSFIKHQSVKDDGTVTKDKDAVAQNQFE